MKIDNKNIKEFLNKEIEESKSYLISNEIDNIDIVIKKIRKNNNKNIYLRPIIIINTLDIEINSYVKEMVDLVISYDDYNNNSYNKILLEKINKNIKLFQNVKEDKDISFKILRMIYSRKLVLIPEMNSETIYGYSYPKLDSFLDKNNDENLFKILLLLKNKNLLEGSFFDKIHSCPECNSTFLNFKEVCTECKSVNIEENVLIHHFACANMSFEKDYIQKNKLICPKCNEELKHIGVDYDKPSTMFHCLDCNNQFQEPNIVVSCFNCKRTMNFEDINKINIEKYKITGLTKNSVIFGFSNLFNNIIHQNVNDLPIDFFNKNLEYEIERIKRYKKSLSTFIMLNISGFDDLKAKHIMNENIFKDLAKIINSFLRTTDMITILTNASFGILLIETDLKGATIAINRLKKEIENLLIENKINDLNINENKILLDNNVEFKNIKKEMINNDWN